MEEAAIGEQVREVFRLFGLAYYHSNCLEHEVLLSLLLLDLLERKAQAARRRGRAALDQRTFEGEFDGFMKRFGRRSLSENLDRLGRYEALDGSVKTMLAKAKERRNDLAHHFFRRNGVAFSKPDGRRAMAATLHADAALFDEAGTSLRACLAPHRVRLGADEARLRDHVRAVYVEQGIDPDTLRPFD